MKKAFNTLKFILLKSQNFSQPLSTKKLKLKLFSKQPKRERQRPSKKFSRRKKFKLRLQRWSLKKLKRNKLWQEDNYNSRQTIMMT